MKFKRYKLNDLSIDGGSYGIGAPAVEYDKKLYTYLRITDINEDGTLNHKDMMSVKDPKANQYILKKNDICFVRTGNSTGKTYFYDGSIENLVYAGFLIKFSIDEEKVNPKYIKYYIMTSKYKNWVKEIQTGSTRGNINAKMYGNLEILIPERTYQDKLVIVLDKITDKIKYNTKTNDNLSEQLQLIYDEWFGKYEINNLPDGWKVEKLKNIATFSQGVQVPIDKQINEEESGYTRFIRIVDITQKNDKDIRFIEDTERGKVEENEIFMIRYGTPGILSWNYKGIIANNLFKITPKVNYLSSNFLYSYFNNNKFQRYIKGNATSSTMPAINFSTLNDRDIIIPTTDLIDKFNKISETIRLKQLSISNQNRVLSDLRDTLLPKLMNGEIDLDKIEI